MNVPVTARRIDCPIDSQKPYLPRVIIYVKKRTLVRVMHDRSSGVCIYILGRRGAGEVTKGCLASNEKQLVDRDGTVVTYFPTKHRNM